MKKWTAVVMVLLLTGCTSVTIPNYIKDENPYRQTYYEDFSRVYDTTVRALEEFGWALESTTDPSLYEHGKTVEHPGAKQILIFTNIRQTPLFIGTRYARMNVYLMSTPDRTTEMEVRYLTINSVPFKNFYNYKQDAAVDRLFRYVSRLLNESQE